MGAENSLSSPRALPGTHWEQNVSGSHRNERPLSPAQSVVKWDEATGLIAPEVQSLIAVGRIFVQTFLRTLYLWEKAFVLYYRNSNCILSLYRKKTFSFS